MTYVIDYRLGVTSVEEKLMQHHLRWFGHIQQRPPEAPVHSGVISQTGNGKRGKGRPNDMIRVHEKRFEGFDYQQRVSIR
jgi:hypothetical protein